MLLTVDLERLDIQRGDLLLDAGCGEGRHCFGALERGAQVIGLDLDMAPLRAASERLQNRATALHSVGGMIRGSTFELPFADATFDKVICSEVMEHVHNYPAALRELARVTKPNGRIAVTIPTKSSEKMYLHLGDDYFESPGGHIRIFEPRVLAQAIIDAGFEDVGIGFAHGIHTPYWVLRSIVGLPRADKFRIVRAYRWILIRAAVSRFMHRFEGRVLNYICPKSLILYAKKRQSGTNDAAYDTANTTPSWR